MKLKPFLKSMFASIGLLGGIYGLVTFGSRFILPFLLVLFMSMVFYDLFDKDYKRRY
jgi:hypothetical protein